MRNWNSLGRYVLTAGAMLLLVNGGCKPSGPTTMDDTKNVSTDASDSMAAGADASLSDTAAAGVIDHGHLPGAHGGIMVSLGRDSYHVEVVVDAEGTIRLYTLGQDESRVIDVESQTLKGYVKAVGDQESQAITFEPTPQEGDTAGKTSLFVGKLPAELVGGQVDVTIPNIRIDGERFRLGFVSGEGGHDESEAMPARVADDAERELYLTAGGRYTESDIAANGNMTASEKFKGLKSDHNMKPSVGDRLCPISGTKANPQFTWIIDGKSYAFCCPPCVDEFLTAAKASNDPLPEPDTFIKK